MAEVDGSIQSQGRPGGVLLFGPYHGWKANTNIVFKYITV